MIDAKIFLEGLESLENDRGVSREVVLNALKEAMEKADVPFKKLTIYEIAYMGTLKLLK